MHDINFHLVAEQNEAKQYVERFFLWPRQWLDFQSTFAAQFDWQVFPLTKKRGIVATVPDVPGLYTLVVQPSIAAHPACSYLMYVGLTGRQTLRKRFRQYLGQEQHPKARPHIIRLTQVYRDFLAFCCSPVPAGTTVEEAEDALLAAYIPPYCRDLPAKVNRVIGGIR
jgi:hypothetical protein